MAGNTNLTGAVISSTAPASANSLITGTLTTSSLARIIHPVEFRAPSFEHLASAGHT